jgi:hypothetical protein
VELNDDAFLKWCGETAAGRPFVPARQDKGRIQRRAQIPSRNSERSQLHQYRSARTWAMLTEQRKTEQLMAVVLAVGQYQLVSTVTEYSFGTQLD